jgi:hypothetical protein
MLNTMTLGMVWHGSGACGYELAVTADGQLIRMLVPAEVSLIWTSSARPAMTAMPKPGG